MNVRTWKAWLVPGGLLLALSSTVINSSLFSQLAPSLTFFYVAVFAAGFLLAWRFNSSRALFSLLALLLAHRAVNFFSDGNVRSGPGRMAVDLVALLLPLNFIAFAALRERGLSVAGVIPRSALLFFQAVIFAVLCRPENQSPHPPRAGAFLIPLWILPSFLLALAVFTRRFFQTRKPIEPGFAWSVASLFLWLQFAPLDKMSDAYVATVALILAASLIETSYVLAYHDELTGIRGRRSFNESLLSLDQQYAIAIVDIDHFKKFNDSYGHDVGDQVLCMVASHLAHAGGDGQAYRCGGEEFALIFRNTSAREALVHLENLRQVIENATFYVRGADRRAARKAETTAAAASERRALTAKPERRKSTRNRAPSTTVVHPPDHLSVTVSIGVAEPSTRYRQPEQVIQAADQALYRAKHKGRNRVELASTAPLRLSITKRPNSVRR